MMIPAFRHSPSFSLSTRRSLSPCSNSRRNFTLSSRPFSTLRFTKDHEWIRVEGGIGVVGISDFAQKELGDVVYADLPEKGSSFKKGDTLVAVESVKAASDVYAPVGGEVVEVNSVLKKEPQTINKSPMGEGWMVKLKLVNPKEVDSLMDEAAYAKHVEQSAHH